MRLALVDRAIDPATSWSAFHLTIRPPESSRQRRVLMRRGRDESGVNVPLPIEPALLGEFCRRHGIRKLSLFGSLQAGTARSDSDVDLLVEFQPDRVPGLLAFVAMEQELSDLLGGPRVDMRTPQDLSRHFRDDVLRQAETLHAAG